MQDDEPKMVRCPQCGAANRPDAAFCSLCLSRFGEPEPVTPPGNSETPPQAAAAPPGPVTPPTEAEAAPPETPAPPPAAGDNWADEVEAFSLPGSNEPVDDELANLPPELQMELKRPRDQLDMKKVWMRAAVVVALAIVSLSLSIGILALLVNQKISQQMPTQQSQPVQPAPAQSQPTPSPGGPESHPDLGFTLPVNWTGGGTANDIVLRSADNSMTIEILSWQRGAGGRYSFVSGRLQAITENAALPEMGQQMLQYLFGSTLPPGAAASSASAGRVGALTADSSDETAGTYRRAYCFVRGNWTYLAVGSAPLARESELAGTMQAVMRSIQFKT